MPTLKVQNQYRTYLSTSGGIISTGDITFTVPTPPTYSNGYIVFSPDIVSQREIMYYHSVAGNIISIRAENRGLGNTTAKTHAENEAIQINDVAEIFNTFSDMLAQVFYIEKTGGLNVRVWGGYVLYNGLPQVVADTTLTLTNNAANYIKYAPATNIISVDTVNSGNIKAVIVIAIGVISSITPINAKECYTSGGGGGGATNLGFTPSATSGTVTSDTGTSAIIPLGNGTNSGLSLNNYTTAEQAKVAATSNTNSGDNAINSNYTTLATTRSTANNWSAIQTFLNGTFGIRNVADTITSFFSSAATVARTYTLQNRSGILADDTDLALKAPLASPTFTGAITSNSYADVGNGTSGIFSRGIILFSGTLKYLADGNGNELLKFPNSDVAGAVNEFTISNVATGTGPILSATGGDANIDINLVAKGTGRIRANATSLTTTGNIELGHDTDTTLARNAAGVISVEGEVMNGYTTTATAVGITTLTIASNKTQYFTGVTTQTVRLPTTSVIVGQPYIITNLSTGLVTVQSSGINTIVTLGLNQTVVCTAIVATPTTAGNWTYVKSHLSGNANGKRILIVTQSATPATNTDNGDIFQITGLAQAITSMSSGLTGTPVAGDMIMFQITDNATARAITWGASFASTTVALPTTTVISTMLRVGFQRNNANTIWDCIAVA